MPFNPLAQEAIASVIRSILKLGAGYLVAKGVWGESAATDYVAAAALALTGLGWSYWVTYASRIKLLTALTMPKGATEAQVETKVAAPGPNPAATTPKDEAPKP